MKFTEGYWLPSEKANASHAMQAYEVEQIPGGMRILATTRPIEHRGMTLNLPTITVEFVAHTPDTISMEAWHYEAYDNKVPSFDKTESVYEDVTVTINAMRQFSTPEAYWYAYREKESSLTPLRQTEKS